MTCTFLIPVARGTSADTRVLGARELECRATTACVGPTRAKYKAGHVYQGAEVYPQVAELFQIHQNRRWQRLHAISSLLGLWRGQMHSQRQWRQPFEATTILSTLLMHVVNQPNQLKSADQPKSNATCACVRGQLPM